MTRRPRSPALTARLAVILSLAVAACGSGVGGPQPMWTGQLLAGDPGPDHPTQLAVDGDQVVLVMLSDEGVITGFATDDRGRFRAGEALATGHRYLGLGGVTRFGAGWIALGSGGQVDSEKLLFEIRAFRSMDGRTWTELDASGLDDAADVTGMTTVDGGLVAVGALRTADEPARGGVRPVAWWSADGARWTTVPLARSGETAGTVQGLAPVGHEVLAVGAVDGQGTMWSSTDRGASWAIVERDGVPPASSLTHIAAQGDVLVASGTTPARNDSDGEGSQLLLLSTDGGHQWRTAVDPPPPNRGEEFAFPLFAGGGLFFTLHYSFIDALSDPELCYADIELCRQDTAVAVYVSDDGDHWNRVDTSGIGEAEAADLDAITATADGRIVAIGRAERGVGTWTWPAGVPLLTEDEPVDPTTDVEVLAEDDVPQIGRRYGVPLYIHCGMDWLYVGGEPWQRTDDGPDVATGAGAKIPDDWPVAQQTIFGFATLVSPDVIEYTIDGGEVIATYGPAAQPPPGCA